MMYWTLTTMLKMIIGSGGVGKTCYTRQCFWNYFSTQVRLFGANTCYPHLAQYDPTIEDCYRKMFTFGNNKMVIELLDPAGYDQSEAECLI